MLIAAHREEPAALSGCAGGLACAIAVPLLPKSYTERMNTIQTYQGDQSAATRVAVWGWTWAYAKDHPLGGGFEAYRGNRLSPWR